VIRVLFVWCSSNGFWLHELGLGIHIGLGLGVGSS